MIRGAEDFLSNAQRSDQRKHSRLWVLAKEFDLSYHKRDRDL